MIQELAFAFIAGAIATANPCGFALLPAYLAHRLAAADTDRQATAGAIARALLVGAVTTGGFLLVFGLAGGALALGASQLTRVFPWAGLAIGPALVAAGAAVLAGRRLSLRLPGGARGDGAGGLRGDLLFGLGYATASLSCTLPIFLAVTGVAATGGPLASAASLIAYGLGMGTVLTSLALAAALSRHGLASAIRDLLPHLGRLSGALLVLAGAYVTYFWGYTLFAPSLPGEGNPILIGESLSGALRSRLAGPTGQGVMLALLALIAALAALTLWRRIAARKPTHGPSAGNEQTRDAPSLSSVRTRGR